MVRFFQMTEQITKFLLKTALEKKNFLFLGLYGEKKVKIQQLYEGQIKVEMGTYRQDFGPPTFVIVNTHLPSVCLEVGPSFLYLGAH